MKKNWYKKKLFRNFRIHFWDLNQKEKSKKLITKLKKL